MLIRLDVLSPERPIHGVTRQAAKAAGGFTAAESSDSEASDTPPVALCVPSPALECGLCRPKLCWFW